MKTRPAAHGRVAGLVVSITPISDDVALRRLPDYKVHRSKVERYPTAKMIDGIVSVPATFTPGAVEDVPQVPSA